MDSSCIHGIHHEIRERGDIVSVNKWAQKDGTEDLISFIDSHLKLEFLKIIFIFNKKFKTMKRIISVFSVFLFTLSVSALLLLADFYLISYHAMLICKNTTTYRYIR